MVRQRRASPQGVIPISAQDPFAWFQMGCVVFDPADELLWAPGVAQVHRRQLKPAIDEVRVAVGESRHHEAASGVQHFGFGTVADAGGDGEFAHAFLAGRIGHLDGGGFVLVVYDRAFDFCAFSASSRSLLQASSMQLGYTRLKNIRCEPSTPQPVDVWSGLASALGEELLTVANCGEGCPGPILAGL